MFISYFSGVKLMSLMSPQLDLKSLTSQKPPTLKIILVSYWRTTFSSLLYVLSSINCARCFRCVTMYSLTPSTVSVAWRSRHWVRCAVTPRAPLLRSDSDVSSSSTSVARHDATTTTSTALPCVSTAAASSMTTHRTAVSSWRCSWSATTSRPALHLYLTLGYVRCFSLQDV